MTQHTVVVDVPGGKVFSALHALAINTSKKPLHG